MPSLFIIILRPYAHFNTAIFFVLCIPPQDEQLKGVVGASGGSMIIAGTTEVLLNHFAKGMDPLSSVLAPRVYHQVLCNPKLLNSLFYCFCKHTKFSSFAFLAFV
jgi:hypothetical protein